MFPKEQRVITFCLLFRYIITLITNKNNNIKLTKPPILNQIFANGKYTNVKTTKPLQ